jgi:hypothetical protein
MRTYDVRLSLEPHPIIDAELQRMVAEKSNAATFDLTQVLFEDLASRDIGPWIVRSVVATSPGEAFNKAADVVNAQRTTHRIPPVNAMVRWVKSGNLHLVIGRSTLAQGGAPESYSLNCTIANTNYSITYVVAVRGEAL